MALQHRRRNHARRWVARYRRRWRNHPRRRIDRIERLVVCCLLAVFVVCLPVAASVGQAIYKHSVAVAEQMKAAGHWATAVVLRDVPAGTAQVQARWRQADGPSHTGLIQGTAGDHAGTTHTLWLNASGMPTTPPPATFAIARQCRSLVRAQRPPRRRPPPIAPFCAPSGVAGIRSSRGFLVTNGKFRQQSLETRVVTK